ncbi:MAG: site-specific integrase [Thaumarchaeota archaeon]|nr:site-specific integrase [Nitrososphaerota archaeon]
MFKEMASFGSSKVADKTRGLREGKEFFHYYKGKIYSYSTLENYEAEAKTFVHWCADNQKLKNAYAVNTKMMEAYLAETGKELSPNTIKTRLAAVTKMVEMVDIKTGGDKAKYFHEFSKQFQQSLPKVTPKRPTLTSEQINQLGKQIERSSPSYALAFQIHKETGCRLRELSYIRRDDLLGLVNNQTQGLIRIDGKGGREREVLVSYQTYMDLDDRLAKSKVLCGYDGYRHAFRRAAEFAGLRVTATHAVRRYAAQELARCVYHSVRSQGLTTKEAKAEALAEVNRMLGHSPNRTSTTQIYINARG